MQYLSLSIWSNTVQEYIVMLITFVVVLLALKIFKFTILKKLKHISKKTRTEFDDAFINAIDAVRWPFYILLSLYIALSGLALPEYLDRAATYIIIIVLTYYGVRIIQAGIDYGAQYVRAQQEKKSPLIDTSGIDTLTKIVKVALWFVAFILILANLGYNVSTLIAGLGIGGIAIAFALQNILSDIFSSFSIYFDKPFQTGDFIIIDEDMGVVERIGIKSTRIKTLQGEELVISNKELTSTRVHNFKKLRKRRVVFAFGVTYETPNAKLEKIPAIVKEICEALKKVEFDRANFKDFGDFSLNFEIVYYLDSNDYNEYMHTRQAINLALKERFEKEKIEFAYPTQVLYLKK